MEICLLCYKNLKSVKDLKILALIITRWYWKNWCYLCSNKELIARKFEDRLPKYTIDFDSYGDRKFKNGELNYAF